MGKVPNSHRNKGTADAGGWRPFIAQGWSPLAGFRGAVWAQGQAGQPEGGTNPPGQLSRAGGPFPSSAGHSSGGPSVSSGMGS